MKRILLTSIIFFVLLAVHSYAQMGGVMGGPGGMMGTAQQQTEPAQSQQYHPCQIEHGYGMGHGYGMMGYGMGYGPGTKGYGMQRGYGMMGYGMGPGMMSRGMHPGYGFIGRGIGACGCSDPGMGPGYGMGPGIMMFSTQDEYQKFLDDTVDLRKQVHEKMFDYHEALRNTKTEPETVSKIEKEIKELKKKIIKKAL